MGGGIAQRGVEGVGLAREAGAVVLDIDGNVGEGDLDSEGATNRLLDPPDGVGGEPRAAGGVEEVDGTQEADRPFLHEVVEGEAVVLVAPGDGDDEAVVGGDEGGAGGGGGAEGVLIEGPAVEGASHGRRVVEHTVKGAAGHSWDLRRGEG